MKKGGELFGISFYVETKEEVEKIARANELVQRIVAREQFRNILQIVWQMREELNETGGAYNPDVDETLHGVGLRLQKLKENQQVDSFEEKQKSGFECITDDEDWNYIRPVGWLTKWKDGKIGINVDY